MRRWKPKTVSRELPNGSESLTKDSLGQGLRVAIIGSGPAGIFCADRLAELAQIGEAKISGAVQLFRSRSKLSASQMETEHNTIYPRAGAPFFDYGCQYITAGDPWFRHKMQIYEKAGICHRWPVGVLSIEGGYEPIDPIPGWAGVRGMWIFQEQVVEHIAAERRDVLKVHHAVERWPPAPGDRWVDSTAGPNANKLMVTNYEKLSDGTWLLRNSCGDTFGPFDVLIGAYYSHAHTHQQLCSEATRPMRNYLHKNLRFAPLMVVWVAFERSLELDFNAAFVVGDSRLVWVSNNNAKVGKGIAFEADGRELWTLIASAQYSIQSVTNDDRGHKRRAFTDLVTAFGKFIRKDVWSHNPKLIRANHWGGAMPLTTLPSDLGCVFDSKQSLGWCGSWATYSGVEGAAVSGKQMAELVAGLSRGASVPIEAEYPQGEWLDICCRIANGRVCLSHGSFHVEHPRLQNTMLLPRFYKEPEGLRRCLDGWDFGGSCDDVEANRDSSGLSFERSSKLEKHDNIVKPFGSGDVTEGKNKECKNKRWVRVQTT